MIRFSFRYFLLISIPAFLPAETNDIPAVSSGDIKFYVDHTVFKGDDSSAIIEFSLMVYADNLVQVQKEGKNISEFKATTEINGIHNFYRENEWTTEAAIKDSADLKTLTIYDDWNDKLLPGEYSVIINLEDVNSSRSGKAEFVLNVPSMQNENFSGSQIKFVSDVKKGDKENAILTPNTARRFGFLNPVLYFYYELYNLPGNEGDKYAVNYSISGIDGNTVKSFPEIKFEKKSNRASFIHGLNVSSINTGTYSLNAEIKSESSEAELKLSRNFEVIQIDRNTPEILASNEEMEQAGNMIKHLVSEAQFKEFQNLNSAGKARFLINFWKSSDPTPDTKENEYLEKIRRRFNYANKNFGWGKTEGWNTERGRVLIQYGMPDEIEQNYYEPNTVPYEIWIYRLEKKFIFVFGDLQSNGKFVLLHSDKEGEVYNIGWKENVRIIN